MVDRLSERIHDEVLESLRRLVMGRVRIVAEICAHAMVSLTHALEHELGKKEGFEAARRAFMGPLVDERPRPSASGTSGSLQAYCAGLESGCAGTQEWERVEDRPDRIGYRFHRCIWAELFRELGRPDIGHWFCDGDADSARAFDPRIGFQRTRVLMDGDPYCDHLYYLEPEER
jgi:hypothetical protein